MKDIMSLLNIKRENTNFGFYSYLIFAIFKIFIFIGSCFLINGFDYFELFSLLFYLSIIGLCIRGFKFNQYRLVDVGTTILFIYSGVQGFIMLPGIVNIAGDSLMKIFIILNFLLNISTCLSFSLFISNWISYRENLGNIERLMLLLSSFISLAIFVISIIINWNLISSDITLLFPNFAYLANVFFYLALAYSTYVLYK